MTEESTSAVQEPALSKECADALSHLAELLDHAMAEPEADLVRAHLEVCEVCTEAADVEEQVRVLIRRACLVKAPEKLRLRILSQVIIRTVG